jgi:acid phosphatase
MFSKSLFALALLATQGLAKKDWVKGKAFDRIAIIWLENTDYDLAIGDPNLAALAKKGISLTNKFAVTHPSMPNYAAAVSGDYYGINHDNMVNIPSNISTVVDLLEDKGVSWGEYQEGEHSSYQCLDQSDSDKICHTLVSRAFRTLT